MTDDPTPDTPAITDVEDTTFVRLEAELAELGFEATTATTTTTTGTRTFTATDSPMVVMLDPPGDPGRAALTVAAFDANSGWEITFTHRTPDDTQIVLLYAALHPHRAAEGLRVAATALGNTAQP